MPIYPLNADRCRELSRRLEASADRICDYQDRLLAGISSLKSIEYDRLLDDYRAELIRYDRLERELAALEEPRKSKEYVEWRRMYQQRKKSEVKY